MTDFPYKRGGVSMIPDGTRAAVIHEARAYDNPSGANKIILDLSLEDGTLFTAWITPGFKVFDELLVVAGVGLDKVEGSLKLEDLKDKMVTITTKLTKDNAGNDWCNITTIKLADQPGQPATPATPATPAPVAPAQPATTPATPAQPEAATPEKDLPFPDDGKK